MEAGNNKGLYNIISEQLPPKKQAQPKKDDGKQQVPVKKKTPVKTVTKPTEQGINQNKEEVLKLHRTFKFYTKNSTTPIQIQINEGIVNDTIQMSNDLGISIPLSYIRKIFDLYGDNIFQIAIPKQYEKDLIGKKVSIDLQLESYQSLFNLLLEQDNDYVVLRIKNNVLEPKSYNDKSGITLRSIVIQPKNKLRTSSSEYPYPDKSDTVSQMKKQLGYTTDQTDIMTNDFSKFIIEYQKKNQLPVTGEIDYDLVINVFPKLNPSNTTTSTPPVPNTEN